MRWRFFLRGSVAVVLLPVTIHGRLTSVQDVGSIPVPVSSHTPSKAEPTSPRLLKRCGRPAGRRLLSAQHNMGRSIVIEVVHSDLGGILGIRTPFGY